MTAELAEFVRMRYAALVRRAFLLVGDQATAEDLVQEALARTWAAERRRPVADLEAYTRRVMVNLLIDRHRRRRVAEQSTADLDSLAATGAATDPALHDAMWRMLQSLSPQQRTVLVLRYYEDLTESEIADALHVTVGTVRQHAARGLQHLRAVMTPTREAHTREEH